MNVKHHRIAVEKTGNYYSYNLDGESTEVFVLIHGYAQTASEFLKTFSFLKERKNVGIIAIEGLSYFYKKGLGGTPASSWMTALNRESEISDYTKYIEAVLDKELTAHCKINVISFSQGVSTALRWLAYSKFSIDKCICIAGSFPSEVSILDLDYNELYFLYGKDDPFIVTDKIDSIFPQENIVTYEGSHIINDNCLELIKSKCLKQ